MMNMKATKKKGEDKDDDDEKVKPETIFDDPNNDYEAICWDDED